MGPEIKRAAWEGGFASLELLLSLPVMALIFMGLVMGVTVAAKNYLAQRVQAEVQQEVQQAFVRVVDDCMSATSLSGNSDSEYIKIYDGDRLVKVYFVNEDSKHVRKLVENLANLPMTGNHDWAKVEVTSFGMREVDHLRCPGLYRIWLEAKSTKSRGIPYGLVTEVYLPSGGGI